MAEANRGDTVGTRAWLGLALTAIGLAGTMALLIALARTPAVKPFLPQSYFEVLLAGHVDLFLVVWYLVMPVLLWRHLGLIGAWPERVSFYAIAAGVAGIVGPVVAGLGKPVPANYVPYLVHPVFLAGLAVFFLGIGVAAAQAAGGRRGGGAPLAAGGRAAAACVLAALAAVAVLSARLALRGELSVGSLTLLVWVGGHILQFAHVANMVTAWGVLLGGHPAGDRTDVRRLAAVARLYPVGAAVGLAAAIAAPTDVLAGIPFMKNLQRFGLGVPTALALALAFRAWLARRGDAGAGRAWTNAVGAGMLVFAVGGALALFADLQRQTTLVPAHYHGVLAAVALAFMGLTYLLIAREGVPLPRPRWAAIQPYLYSLGVVAFVAGLAWAGGHGAPRKTAGAGFAAGDPATLAALNLMGLGGLLAVAGGAAYVLNAALAVYRWVTVPAGAPEGRSPSLAG